MTRDDKRGLIGEIMMLLMMPVIVALTVYLIRTEQYPPAILGALASFGALIAMICGSGVYYLEKYRKFKKQKEEQEVK